MNVRTLSQDRRRGVLRSLRTFTLERRVTRDKCVYGGTGENSANSAGLIETGSEVA